MASSAPVIIFGPTGAVGSRTALTAYEFYSSLSSNSDQNADFHPKIILAMRDPAKSIPILPSSAMFQRVQADLTDVASVSSAVKSTGARRAFVYLVHPNSDHLRASLSTMKDAGIEFVVFLSSFTIDTENIDEMRDIKQSDLIPWIHVQVELNLHEIFGSEGYVAVRPGAFASNNVAWKRGIEKGVVEVYKPDLKLDQITAKDMGCVCGRILVGDAPKDKNAVYLYGPKLVSQREAIMTIANVLNKEVEVREISKEDFIVSMVSEGRPEPLARYMTKLYEEIEHGGQTNSNTAHDNVQMYGGQSPTHFEDWVKKNQHLFQ